MGTVKPLFNARAKGLTQEWIDRLEETYERGAVTVLRTVLGAFPSSSSILPGDIILQANKKIIGGIKTLEEICLKCSEVDITLWRGDKSIETKVKLSKLRNDDDGKIVQFVGANFHQPMRELFLRLNTNLTKNEEGRNNNNKNKNKINILDDDDGEEEENDEATLGAIYCSLYYFGSPSDRYSLRARCFVSKINDIPVKNLNDLINVIKGLPKDTNDWIRIEAISLTGRKRIVPLKLNEKYYPSKYFYSDENGNVIVEKL